jgi:hypothetical protein
VISTAGKDGESESEGDELKHRASKRTKKNTGSICGDFFIDITHNGIETNEELNDSLILVHQNMGLS